MKFKITNHVKYTEIAIVEADNYHAAYLKASKAIFEHQEDDVIIDQDCEEIHD